MVMAAMTKIPAAAAAIAKPMHAALHPLSDADGGDCGTLGGTGVVDTATTVVGASVTDSMSTVPALKISPCAPAVVYAEYTA